MALALNASHPLASRVKVLIGVDPATGTLVDLARTGVTFTLDAGVSGSVDTPIGKGIRCTGSGTDSRGFSFTDFSIATQVAHEGTLFIVVSKMTGYGGNGSQPIRLPGSTLASNAMMVGFSQTTGNVGLNDGNLSSALTEISPTRNIVGDNQWHSFAVQQWSAGGWTALNGALFMDGVDTGVAMSNKPADRMHINGFARNMSTSWAGDFVWMAFFDKKLTAAEISGLHTSIGAGNAFALVTGSGAVVTPPSGVVTIATVTPATTSASVAYSYSASDATAYEYRLNGGTAAALGASPATLSGLTAGTTYTLEIRATNGSGASAWSAARSFTTAATPPADTTAPTLAGTITISSLGSTSYTASWPAATDNVAVTGYEYRINAASSWTSTGAGTSANIAGRTPGATDTFEVRAYDAAGNRSAALSKTVTLAAAAAGGRLSVADPLKNNAGAVQANLTGIIATVLRASDFTAVATVANLTTNSTGILASVTHASIVAGTQYHLALKTAGGGIGITGPITAA